MEFPLSGYGNLLQASPDLADYALGALGPRNPRFFIQANGWGGVADSGVGDWGATSGAIETQHDAVWTRSLCRGEQAIQPSDNEWTSMYDAIRANKATYAEVYATSFLLGDGGLAAEIAKFNTDCQAATPLP